MNPFAECQSRLHLAEENLNAAVKHAREVQDAQAGELLDLAVAVGARLFIWESVHSKQLGRRYKKSASDEAKKQKLIDAGISLSGQD
jgi:hypothetical protein